MAGVPPHVAAGSIPWMMVPELFTQGPRTVAVNIGVLTNWFANFVVGQAFPPLQVSSKARADCETTSCQLNTGSGDA